MAPPLPLRRSLGRSAPPPGALPTCPCLPFPLPPYPGPATCVLWWSHASLNTQATAATSTAAAVKYSSTSSKHSSISSCIPVLCRWSVLQDPLRPPSAASASLSWAPLPPPLSSPCPCLHRIPRLVKKGRYCAKGSWTSSNVERSCPHILHVRLTASDDPRYVHAVPCVHTQVPL